jgi:hypothetical protein
VSSSEEVDNFETPCEKIDLAPMIAQSRQTDAIYNINNTISAEAQENESIELSIKMSKNNSKLSQNVLLELEEPKPKTVHFQISEAADYFEID